MTLSIAASPKTLTLTCSQVSPLRSAASSPAPISRRCLSEVFDHEDLFHSIMGFLPVEERGKQKYARVCKVFYHYSTSKVASLAIISSYSPERLSALQECEDEDVLKRIASSAAKRELFKKLESTAMEQVQKRASIRESWHISLQCLSAVGAAIAISTTLPPAQLRRLAELFRD